MKPLKYNTYYNSFYYSENNESIVVGNYVSKSLFNFFEIEEISGIISILYYD